ncbi:MAG: hypothetical protein ACR2MG_13560 [Pyrinomonadaceae bacterium]
MPNNIFQVKTSQTVFLIVIIVSVLLIGCTVKAAKEKNTSEKENNQPATITTTEAKNSDSRTKIKISPNSPADTVRVFYKNLREQRFREAMFLTNLRPAIEGLTDDELKDLQVDFALLAGQIPADVAINGEIIAGKFATVTAKLPDNETDKIDLQEIKLRQENGVWIILTVDETAEKKIRKEGKNYFFALKIETHQKEAKAMLNRIDKAQMVFSMQNNGLYADIPTLVKSGFLPEDIQTPDSTGYIYKIYLSPDRKNFSATAEPAVYGKTGKLSFWYEVKDNKSSSLHSKDNNGKPFSDTKKF